MRALFAVARREIVEKRFVFAAAGVAAVVPFVIPIARQLTGESASVARQATALILATLIGAGLSVALGVSLFTADLMSRRMSFYFAKPISAGSLWGGKLLAAAALVVAGVSIPLLPTMLVNRDLSQLRDVPGANWTAIGWGIGVLIVLMLLFNAIAIVIRSHSALALLDVLAAVGVLLAGLALFVRLIPMWIVLLRRFDPARLFVGSMGLIVASIALVSSYWAITRGRTDMKNVHRRHFEVLWISCGGGLLAIGLYSLWALAAPPKGIRIEAVRAAGPSGWVWLEGVGRGSWCSFLYDTVSGRFERLSSWRVGLTAVSSDGKNAAWTELNSSVNPLHLMSILHDGGSKETHIQETILKARRLDQAQGGAVTTGIRFDPGTFFILISNGGTAVAGIKDDTVSVFDVKTARLWAAFHFPKGSFAGAWFVGSERIRVLRRRGDLDAQNRPLESFEIDIPHRLLTMTGLLNGSAGKIIRSSADDHLLIADTFQPTLRIVETNSLSVLTTISPSERYFDDASFRSDGGVVLVVRKKRELEADFFSKSGESEGRFPLGSDVEATLGMETADGRFPVSLHFYGKGKRRLMFVGPPARSSSEAEALIPVGTSPYSARTRSMPAGCEAGKLFFSFERELPLVLFDPEVGRLFFGLEKGLTLVRFDPVTGERRLLLGRR